MIRWGILGAAQFARRDMGPAIHAAKGGKLAALATRDPAKAAGFEAFQPELQVFDSYDALLASDIVDAVYIPLPNAMHVPWTLKALDAGKHVLCEKPVAMAAEEIDALIETRDRTGLLAAEAYMIVHHPQWHKARDLLADGAVGELAHIEGHFSFERPGAENIRMQAGQGGGGLRDIGVYTFGSARFATGLEPDDITARIRYQEGVDVHAQVWARFGAATYGAVVSMSLFRSQQMAFHGPKGVLLLSAPFNASVIGEAQVVLHRPGSETQIWRYPAVNQYVAQVEAFNHSVATGAAYPCPLEFSRGTQAMIDAALAADPE